MQKHYNRKMQEQKGGRLMLVKPKDKWYNKKKYYFLVCNKKAGLTLPAN